MSGVNDTDHSNQNNATSGWLPCLNATTSNGTDPERVVHLCRINNTGASSYSHVERNLKTFHMHKDYRNPTDLYVGPYDPASGIRTACILGSFLLFITVYVIYKAKCKKNRWTSADELFIEKYKQKLAEKEFSQRSTRRKSFHEMHVKQEIAALEATAKWIQSQPLDQVSVPRKKSKQANVCNVCLQALDTPSCPTCSKSQSRVSMETNCPVNTVWALNSQKQQQTQEKLGLVSLALNQTKDVAQVPLYKNARYAKNDHNDRSKWKINFLNESRNLDGRLKKYSNVEYLNLHVNSPKSNNGDEFKDNKCTKMNVAKLLGSKSYEHVASDDGAGRGNGREMIPLLLQTGRQRTASSSGRTLTEGASGSDDELANNAPTTTTTREPSGRQKSDAYLQPPYHHGSLPTNQLVVPSPHLLSPYHRPEACCSHPSQRPKRSTLSLNLPNASAGEMPRHGCDVPPPKGEQQRSTTALVLPSADRMTGPLLHQ